MMHRYFKMDNILCRIVSDTSLFMHKTRVLAASTMFPSRIHAVSMHQRSFPHFFGNKLVSHHIDTLQVHTFHQNG